MMLGDFDGNRENNFTLVRLIFALAVLVGHSFPITGNGSDPLSVLMLPHTWIGATAVGGFFAISGYLITASFVQRGSRAFIASRALRLYPAVIVHCAVAILIIGPIVTSVPLSQYFASNPWQYFKNSWLWEWKYNLPYAFGNVPLAGATNGSSWTLPVELRCYVLVLILGFFGVLDKKARANVAIFAALFALYRHPASLHLFHGQSNFAEPLSFFLWGAALWVNRSIIPLSWPVAAVVFAGIIASAKYNYYFVYLYPLCTAYLVCMIAYRTPFFDVDRTIGDISYGVYIYAWPIQQAIYRPGQGAWTNAAISTVIVVIAALLSWRYVEKPALEIRKKLFLLGRNVGNVDIRAGQTNPIKGDAREKHNRSPQPDLMMDNAAIDESGIIEHAGRH